jgi:glycosyltransferase involved in cell wall biosynthesis
MKLTLCLLTYNELEGCKNDIPLIDRGRFDEIYCVDGGSSDGTVEYLKSEGIEVYRQPVKGLNQACIHAFKKCSTDALIFFHPKGSIPVEDTLKFRQYFEQGYELVVGSRVSKGGVNEEDSKFFRPRKIFVKGLALVGAICFKREGNLVWDSLHGFRGMTVNAFKRMNITPDGLSVDIETICRAYKLHISRIEFATIENPRLAGETHFKAIPTGLKLLKYIWQEMMRRD